MIMNISFKINIVRLDEKHLWHNYLSQDGGLSQRCWDTIIMDVTIKRTPLTDFFFHGSVIYKYLTKLAI